MSPSRHTPFRLATVPPIRARGNDPGNSIVGPVPAGTQPAEILFFKLKVALSGSTTVLELTYDFEQPKSGRYPIGTPTPGNPNVSSLADFIQKLKLETLPPGPLPLYAANDVPNLHIQPDCHVVVQLETAPAMQALSNIRFQARKEALRTEKSLSSFYGDLTHYDSNFAPVSGQQLAPDNCTLIHFTAKGASAAEMADTNYTIQCQFNQASGNPIILAIDPAIKNRG